MFIILLRYKPFDSKVRSTDSFDEPEKYDDSI